MRGPPVAILQDHEDSVVRQRLEEVIRVHTGPVFVQHQGVDTRHTERVADLRERRQGGAAQANALYTNTQHCFNCASYCCDLSPPYRSPSGECSQFPLSPFNTHTLLALFIRSFSASAMMPFFTLRSAFVTLKGFSRRARPDSSCWVMEALAETLADTHLGEEKRCGAELPPPLSTGDC